MLVVAIADHAAIGECEDAIGHVADDGVMRDHRCRRLQVSVERT